MNRNKSVMIRVSDEFYKKMENARRDYSAQLKKDISTPELTRIWGEGKLANFKVPKLRMRKWR